MDYKSLDDHSLMRLIAHRREEALSELYDRYSRLVFSVALNAAGSDHAAEEIVQDVFTRVWEKAGTYDSSLAKVSTWIVTITRNRAIDELRRGRLRLDQSSMGWEEVSPENHPQVAGPEVEAELRFNQQRVRQAVASLPEDQQAAIALAYFRGYSHSEIAEALGQPLGTVKTRIRLAMQKLHSLLAERPAEQTAGRQIPGS